MKKFYEVLHVNEKSSLTQVQNNYRDLAKKYYPKKHTVEAEEKFKELANAYEILGNPIYASEYLRGSNFESFNFTDPYKVYEIEFNKKAPKTKLTGRNLAAFILSIICFALCVLVSLFAFSLMTDIYGEDSNAGAAIVLIIFLPITLIGFGAAFVVGLIGFVIQMTVKHKNLLSTIFAIIAVTLPIVLTVCFLVTLNSLGSSTAEQEEMAMIIIGQVL